MIIGTDSYHIQTQFSVRIVLLILYMDLGHFVCKKGKYYPGYNEHYFSTMAKKDKHYKMNLQKS